jgi:capsule polysaccharide export protein KpsE/RkpR
MKLKEVKLEIKEKLEEIRQRLMQKDTEIETVKQQAGDNTDELYKLNSERKMIRKEYDEAHDELEKSFHGANKMVSGNDVMTKGDIPANVEVTDNAEKKEKNKDEVKP